MAYIVVASLPSELYEEPEPLELLPPQAARDRDMAPARVSAASFLNFMLVSSLILRSVSFMIQRHTVP